MRLPRAIARGAFVLERMLGAGGMAEVYRARVDRERLDYQLLLALHGKSRAERRRLHAEPRTPGGLAEVDRASLAVECARRGVPVPRLDHVAIKVLVLPGAQVEQRFEDEWISLMSVRHPNVVEVYDGGRDDDIDRPYYAMELIEDPLSFEDLCGLPLEHRLEVVRQVALGLDALHLCGIIHRDVKPENLLCRRESGSLRVTVTDLGVAKDVDRSVLLTQGQPLLGTPNYMAPEGVSMRYPTSRRSDVYSLGATLYALCRGRPPFDDLDLMGILARLASGERPTPLVDVPASVERLIARMMAIEPADRPGDMQDVLAELAVARARLADISEATTKPTIAADTPTLRIDTSSARPAPKVLVVDDEPGIRALIKRGLEQARIAVTVAGNGAEALIKIGQDNFDLILSDISMPHLDGFVLLQVLKQQGITCPVVLLTGTVDDTLVDRASELGAAGFLTKPFNLTSLLGTIEPLLA